MDETNNIDGLHEPVFSAEGTRLGGQCAGRGLQLMAKPAATRPLAST
ncbi:MAG: hypothetical protein IJM64_00070 [Ottowia sp.]|nr:hypothetical protein [Ottowia sp.]